MRRLSSRTTFWYKRVFPVIWFGFLAVFVTVSIFGSSTKAGAAASPDLLFLIVPVAMAAFGYFFMKNYVFDLVDEAFDAGDALLVKNGGREDRIALSDIQNVNYTPMLSPPRVTVSLRKPSVFGDKVSFCAPIQLIPLSNHPIIDEWIKHVDAVREARWRSMQSQARGSS